MNPAREGGELIQVGVLKASDEKRDMGKLITACRALAADVLCLATGQVSWSARTRSAVQAACDGAGICALWLEGLGHEVDLGTAGPTS